jgi:hypothetical protein
MLLVKSSILNQELIFPIFGNSQAKASWFSGLHHYFEPRMTAFKAPHPLKKKRCDFQNKPILLKFFLLFWVTTTEQKKMSERPEAVKIVEHMFHALNQGTVTEHEADVIMVYSNSFLGKLLERGDEKNIIYEKIKNFQRDAIAMIQKERVKKLHEKHDIQKLFDDYFALENEAYLEDTKTMSQKRALFPAGFKQWWNVMKPSDIVIFWQHNIDDLACFNDDELQHQIKLWRREAVNGRIQMFSANNRTFQKGGKSWYTLVVHIYDEGEFSDANVMDPFALHHFGEMVEGFFYCFTTEENRDRAFNFVMKDIIQIEDCEGFNLEEIIELNRDMENEIAQERADELIEEEEEELSKSKSVGNMKSTGSDIPDHIRAKLTKAEERRPKSYTDMAGVKHIPKGSSIELWEKEYKDCIPYLKKDKKKKK